MSSVDYPGTRCNHCVNFTSAKSAGIFELFNKLNMEPNATVTGGDGEMDGQSVRLTEHLSMRLPRR